MSAAATLFTLAAVLQLDKSNYEKGLSEAESGAEKSGSKISKAFSTVGKIAKVGGAAVVGLGAATYTAGKKFVGAAGDVASYGDNIDKMSQKMGISSTAYQEWDAILQHSGSSMDAMKTSMKTLANAAQSGSDAFSKLGISEEEVSTLSQEDLFAKVISGLQNMEEGTERTYLSSQLLGRGATELGALLNTSAEDTEKMRQKVHDLGGVMSEDAVKASAAYQDSLQDMQTAFQGLSKKLMGNFLPGLTKVMDGITSLFSGNGDGVKQISDGIQTITSKLLEAIPKAIEVGGKLIKGIADAIKQNLPVLMEGLKSVMGAIQEMLPSVLQIVKDLIPQLVSTLTEMLPQLVDMGIQLLGSLIEGITEAIPALTEMLPEVIDSILTTLTDNLPKIIEMGLNLIVALADGLIKALPKLVAKIPKIISGLVKALTDSIPKIISAGQKLLVSLVKNLPQIIVEVVKAIPQIIASLVSGIVGSIGQIASAGFKLFKGLVTKIPEAISHIVSKIPSVISGIVKAFAKAPSKMADIGKNLIKGLWNGITGVKDWILDKIGGFTSSVLSSIKGFFGIHSPSRVMRDEVGKMLGLGMAEGIEDSEGDVDDAMSSLMKIPEPYNFDSMTLKKNSTGGTAAAGGTGSLSEALQKILDFLPELANLKIYLDTGALVGQTAGAYNDALGILVSREERSV